MIGFHRIATYVELALLGWNINGGTMPQASDWENEKLTCSSIRMDEHNFPGSTRPISQLFQFDTYAYPVLSFPTIPILVHSFIMFSARILFEPLETWMDHASMQEPQGYSL